MNVSYSLIYATRTRTYDENTKLYFSISKKLFSEPLKHLLFDTQTLFWAYYEVVPFKTTTISQPYTHYYTVSYT